jgi:hypothetical protein
MMNGKKLRRNGEANDDLIFGAPKFPNSFKITKCWNLAKNDFDEKRKGERESRKCVMNDEYMKET